MDPFGSVFAEFAQNQDKYDQWPQPVLIAIYVLAPWATFKFGWVNATWYPLRRLIIDEDYGTLF